MRFPLALVASFLAVACGGGATLPAVPDAGTPPRPDAGDPGPLGPPNPISIENALPGSSAWPIPEAQAVGAELEGYADATSINHGESVGIHLRTDGSHRISWELWRMGFYGGAGGRKVVEGGPLSAGPQPDPVPDPRTGLVECHWPVTFTLNTDRAWASGIYLVKLIRDDGLGRFVHLVIRDDERKGAAVIQSAVATYQAYNDWLGESLYTDGLGLSGGLAKEVSFDRPYQQGTGAGDFLTYDIYLVQWAESLGLDVVYVTNVDVARRDVLRGQKLFVSAGHDEYWSRDQRNAVEAALQAGVNLAFLSGNSAYWQIRHEPERAGTAPDRTIVCYKDTAPAEDPLASTPLITMRWRDQGPGAPEDQLLGVRYEAWQAVDVPYIVRSASHWVYTGTGLRDGDALPFLIGNEADRYFGGPGTPAGIEVLAASPVVRRNGEPTWHNATAYVAPSGAFVFAAGTIEWSWGLLRPGSADARVQRITRNVFERAGLLAASAGPGFVGTVPSSDFTGRATAVAVSAGAAFAEGLEDGAGTVARFRRPTGVAADGAGRIFVADTGNHALRRIDSDAARTVLTLAGTGAAGLGTGAGAQAKLSSPAGVALGAGGALYVTDTGNHRVVRIEGSAPWTVTTFAGSSRGDLGSADGAAANARFNAPLGIAAVGTDLYVADSSNDRICRIDAAGRVSTFAGRRPDGTIVRAALDYPTGVAAGSGALLVLESQSHQVRRIPFDGSASTVLAGGGWAGGYADGAGGSALFLPWFGLLDTPAGTLVADTGNNRLRRVASGNVTTWAGSGAGGAREGDGTAASFSLPAGLAALPDGSVAVADNGASTIRIARR